MPYNTQPRCSRALEGSGDDASQRYWRDLAAKNQATANKQRDEMLKMQKDAQGAQSLQGWLGLGYKGLGGEEGIKELWGKAKDWFNPSYDTPAAYNPAAVSPEALTDYSVNSLADLGIHPETARGLLGDYVQQQRETLWTTSAAWARAEPLV